MTDEEKELKNDALDILEEYLAVANTFNRGDSFYFKQGSLDKKIKYVKAIIRRLRNVTIKEE